MGLGFRVGALGSLALGCMRPPYLIQDFAARVLLLDCASTRGKQDLKFRRLRVRY